MEIKNDFIKKNRFVIAPAIIILLPKTKQQ